MGKITQVFKVTNVKDLTLFEEGYISKDKIRSMDIEFLIDRGASMLCLPIDIIKKLGLSEIDSKKAVTANGVVQRKVYSAVEVKIWDRVSSFPVMELPEGTPPLFGYIPIEALDLYPNPNTQKIEGNPAHDGKMIIEIL